MKPTPDYDKMLSVGNILETFREKEDTIDDVIYYLEKLKEKEEENI